MPSPRARAETQPGARSPEELARGWCDALVRRDPVAFVGPFAADGVLLDVEHRTPDLRDARPIHGRDAIRQLTVDWLERTPAFDFGIAALLSDGTQAAYRWHYAVDGVALHGLAWLTCAAGEIREAPVVFDSYRLLHGLGLAAPSA